MTSAFQLPNDRDEERNMRRVVEINPDLDRRSRSHRKSGLDRLWHRKLVPMLSRIDCDFPRKSFPTGVGIALIHVLQKLPINGHAELTALPGRAIEGNVIRVNVHQCHSLVTSNPVQFLSPDRARRFPE